MLPNVTNIDATAGRCMVYLTGDSLNKILLADVVHEHQVLQIDEFILNNGNFEKRMGFGGEY